ncbi:hypothetical protein Taro_024706 [Colocasia esculenta]|uniref:Sugar phosphate transporter domain-containing protein n=1 Tax=Colocasia esculenta TaxID=4460 RepID=A0A843V707_COLES|nr:hypothetical protein [Colocasia esculenta]
MLVPPLHRTLAADGPGPPSGPTVGQIAAVRSDLGRSAITVHSPARTPTTTAQTQHTLEPSLLSPSPSPLLLSLLLSLSIRSEICVCGARPSSPSSGGDPAGEEGGERGRGEGGSGEEQEAGRGGRGSGGGMVEAGGHGHTQTWTTRRGSNPRLEPDPVIDIPATPPGEARGNGAASKSGAASFLSLFCPTPAAAASFSPTVTTALIIASWYFSNIGVLLLNKYLLSIYGYRYPIFLTMLHMVSCSLYSLAAVHWLGLVPLQHISSRRQLLKIAALSAIFCFSVVCGNTSLRYIPVSFNQAVGATTPFFTAIFAFLLTCRREHPLVYLALLPVVLGIVVASNSEPLFHLFGFLVCVGSTAGRALKSVVQGILLTSEAERLNSMNLLMYMAPIAAAILLPVSLYVEGNVGAATVEKARTDPNMVLLLLGNATVAYLVNLTNFLVTKHTSALTLQVLGNAKAAVAAVVSVLIFRNPVTVMGIAGFAVTIMGVVLYSEAKKRAKS